MAKVNIARGMRDILPDSLRKRRNVIHRIQTVFEQFGYSQLETPAVERIETLMGKYGEEGNQLVFKILARGEKGKQGQTDLALRYDLTVPLARVIAMNQQLPMPFKRYQIQPVWRADRPQKGRFREFYQCDVDVVGTESRIAEAECIAIVHDVLVTLGFERFKIRLNDRRILRAMVEQIDAADRETDILVAIDKLDKIGEKGVRSLLEEQNFTADQVDRLFGMLNQGKIEGVEPFVQALEKIQSWARASGVSEDRLEIDFTLARGLNYYTGPVFETVLTDSNIGSVSGGGRYDGLIGMFCNKNFPAVGVSLGLERLITIMEERNMFDEIETGVDVWVTVFNDDLTIDSISAAASFRSAGLKTIVSTRVGKLGKQFKDANKVGTPWVVVIGPDDKKNDLVLLKNLISGTQYSLSIEEAVIAVVQQKECGE
jgi:histidyl-tRNA synthetase